MRRGEEQGDTEAPWSPGGSCPQHGEVVIKARLYDEAMAKTGTITSLKLIHIYVDYSAKMETILAETWSLFTTQNRFFRSSPIPLEKVPDLV